MEIHIGDKISITIPENDTDKLIRAIKDWMIDNKIEYEIIYHK